MEARGRPPCNDWILTQPKNPPEDSGLQTNPYKDMHYYEIINKIREDRKKEAEPRSKIEQERKNL